MAEDEEKQKSQRIVLLNSLVSRSTCRAQGQTPPTAYGSDLMKVIEDRWKKGWAVEYYGADKDHEHDDDDDKRIKNGQGTDYVRLRDLKFDETKDHIYATALFEYLDTTVSKFAVVNYTTFEGHEISGKTHDRGAVTAHVVARFPKGHLHDDGKYRCTIESVHGVTRGDIEMLLCRQLRRYAKSEQLMFTGENKKGKKQDYRYTPKLELFADVGRKLDVAVSGTGELSGMLFTKRHDKQSTGTQQAVAHQDFLADVRIYVGANQGPPTPAAKLGWAEKIQSYYRNLGYTTKVYFRHASGGIVSGDLHKSVNAAADLLMCQRTHVFLEKPPKNWVAAIEPEIAANMRTLVDEEELWEHLK
ncbi:MAG: hypothetical protein JST16_10740 [Bdellovibrionales bacterium]|nr:hypothetical protein [Bdellovibrionales bacterium]